MVMVVKVSGKESLTVAAITCEKYVVLSCE